MANVREVAAVCGEFETPLYLDACRLTENAYLIKQREPDTPKKSGARIVREIATSCAGLHDEREEGRHRQHGGLPSHPPMLASGAGEKSCSS